MIWFIEETMYSHSLATRLSSSLQISFIMLVMFEMVLLSRSISPLIMLVSTIHSIHVSLYDVVVVVVVLVVVVVVVVIVLVVAVVGVRCVLVV